MDVVVVELGVKIAIDVVVVEGAAVIGAGVTGALVVGAKVIGGRVVATGAGKTTVDDVVDGRAHSVGSLTLSPEGQT